MQVHHLYADETGESRWRTLPVALAETPFAPPARAIELSEPRPATAAVFLRLAAGWDEPAHPSPRRQTLACLAGRVRVTASDGAVREIGPGDVWLMEDTHGRGHHTAVIGPDAFEAMVVQHP